ncbi:hypothetical protein Sjap_004441 [Stephania japonica]|uniref:Uncharacterized protein n=1 Tax=Stephania japonica TaxID=461633 RepID=A0AAP0K296_9MAGN
MKPSFPNDDKSKALYCKHIIIVKIKGTNNSNTRNIGKTKQTNKSLKIQSTNKNATYKIGTAKQIYQALSILPTSKPHSARGTFQSNNIL